MKHITLILIVLILSLGTLVAQADFGVTLGLNMANMSQKNITRNEARTGFNAGAIVQYRVGENSIFQPELLYTTKGVNFDLPLDPFTSLGYVQVPLLFKYNINTPLFNIQPFVGPEVSYLVSAKAGNKNVSADRIDNYNKIEYGLDMGVDLVFLKSFVIGARYDLGLANIIKNPPKNREAYNRTIMVNLSYIIGQTD